MYDVFLAYLSYLLLSLLCYVLLFAIFFCLVFLLVVSCPFFSLRTGTVQQWV